MIDFVQINKFSEFHDGKKIIFCKTDFIIKEFEYIKNLKNDVILITGNSDYSITDDLVNMAPKNIIKWYAQNSLSSNQIIEPMPIGLENRFECIRKGHGVGYGDATKLKEELLSGDFSMKPSKNIYSNFRIETNFRHRSEVKKICYMSKHIDWEEPNLSLDMFFEKIKNYRSVVCPAGNGVDTHRLWEVLYCDRIPITIKMGNFKIYDLYEKLPIVVLDSIYDLSNETLLLDKINAINKNNYDLNILNYEYWKNKIMLSV